MMLGQWLLDVFQNLEQCKEQLQDCITMTLGEKTHETSTH